MRTRPPSDVAGFFFVGMTVFLTILKIMAFFNVIPDKINLRNT